MINITPIVEAVLVLIGTLITTLLVPYIKKKTTVAQREEIVGWCRIAVAAAEQIYAGQGRGEEKKQFVLAWLEDHGVDLNDSKIEAMVEAAVYELTYGYLLIDGVAQEK